MASPSSPSPSSGRESSHRDLIGLDSVRIYAVLQSDIKFVAELEHIDAASGTSDVNQQEQVLAEPESGDLFLAFIRKGVLVSMASLVEGDSDEEEEELTGNDDEDEAEEEDDYEDESEEEDDYDDESEEDDALAEEDSWEWDEESQEEGEEEEEDDKDFESDGNKHVLKLRVWPSSCHANLVLFDRSSWVSTKDYSLHWLSSTDVKSLVQKLSDNSIDDISMDDQSILSNDALVKRSEYKGAVVNSRAAQIFIKAQLSPSMYDFSVKQILGKGSFCNVRLCTCRSNNKDYAIKIIRIKEKNLIEPREVGILSSLKSPYVVKFFQAWVEDHLVVDYEECSSQSDDSRDSGKGSTYMQRPKYIMIQMELCPGTLQGELSVESRKIDCGSSLLSFKEMVLGVQYIHAQNVIHRDLKPANIFMGKDGKMKLGDFGQSCVRPMGVDSFKATPNLGTLFYEAPELQAGVNISTKVDVYSLGAIYLELFTVWKTKMDREKTFKCLQAGDDGGISWEGDLMLFMQMVAKDPPERPSADAMLDYISKE